MSTTIQRVRNCKDKFTPDQMVDVSGLVNEIVGGIFRHVGHSASWRVTLSNLDEGIGLSLEIGDEIVTPPCSPDGCTGGCGGSCSQ